MSFGARVDAAAPLWLNPSALFAMGVLVLNDHVAKDAVGGAVVGKVSDAAGVYVAAFVVAGAAAFAGQLTSKSALVAAVAPLALLAAVKLHPAGASGVEAALDALRHFVARLWWAMRGTNGSLSAATITADPGDVIAGAGGAAAAYLVLLRP